jgi:hypothetical protein
MYAPTKLMQKETKYDLEAILRIMFAGRLCTGGRGVGDGGVSAERVDVGGGGRCKERGGTEGDGRGGASAGRDGRVQMVVEGCYGGNGHGGAQ